MNIRLLITYTLATTLIFSSKLLLAADPVMTQDREQTQTQKQVYGRQLMTEQERTDLRAKMRTAKTTEEREQIRLENHQRMNERAKERGVTLNNELPRKGGGMGMRKDMNSKMKGMGAGGGRWR